MIFAFLEHLTSSQVNHCLTGRFSPVNYRRHRYIVAVYWFSEQYSQQKRSCCSSSS